MVVMIGEQVKVMAVFDPEIRPVKFRWKGRLYPVKEVTHRWASRQGSSSLVHFSVTDGATLFELVYDASAMKWSLGGVE